MVDESRADSRITENESRRKKVDEERTNSTNTVPYSDRKNVADRPVETVAAELLTRRIARETPERLCYSAN